jgi:cytochrome P450
LILNNREVLEKAQDELDIQVGKHRQVDETDIKNLVYLQAIVKETMRLYPAAPLSAPRQAMEDCTVAGFHIPAGTRLLVNLWKLHRDPNIWSNPLEFQPERFLKEHANLDVRGQDFEYVPFGSGRRMCPGISLALQVLHLTLARLLHGFEMGTVSDALIDMSEGPGITIPKETPLEVILRPRLHSSLYEC